MSNSLLHSPAQRGLATTPHETTAVFVEDEEEDGLNMYERLELAFRALPLRVALLEVSVIDGYTGERCRALTKCCTASLPQLRCQSVSAYMMEGGLHAIVDVDGLAGAALLRVVNGERLCSSGALYFNGVQLDRYNDEEVRRLRACVRTARSGAVSFAYQTVKEVLSFATRMRLPCRDDWLEEMVSLTARFVELDPLQRAASLDRLGTFRLHVAMQLLLDPPLLCLEYPFHGMDLACAQTAADLLQSVSSVLHKTVICCLTRWLPPSWLGAAANSLVLFSGSQVVYSGPCRLLFSYFNQLRIPQNVEHQPSAAAGGAGGDDSTPPSVLLRTLPRVAQTSWVTPTRLSSLQVLDGTGTRLVSTDHRSGSRLRTDEIVPLVVIEADEAVELALEWTESEAQKLFYAAKYYDSSIHQQVVAGIDADAHEPCSTDLEMEDEVQRSALSKSSLLLPAYLRQVRTEPALLAGLALWCVAVAVGTVVALRSRPDSDGDGSDHVRTMKKTQRVVFGLFITLLVLNVLLLRAGCREVRVAMNHCRNGLYGVAMYMCCLAISLLAVHALCGIVLLPFVRVGLRASWWVPVLAAAMGLAHHLLLYVLVVLTSARNRQFLLVLCLSLSYVIVLGFTCYFPYSGSNRVWTWLSKYTNMLRWGYGPALKDALVRPSYACDDAADRNHTSTSCVSGQDFLTLIGLRDDAFGRFFALTAGVSCLLLLLLYVSFAVKKKWAYHCNDSF